MTEELEVLTVIEDELKNFKDDEKSVFGGYGKEDFRNLINKIAFVMQNNRCDHCNKLLTLADFNNMECHCGYSILESLKSEQPLLEKVE